MSLVQLLLREAPINATGPHGVMVFYPVGYALNSRRRIVPSCRLPQHRLALHTSVCNATVAKHCCFEEDQSWRGAACHKNANVKFVFVCVCACVRVRVSAAAPGCASGNPRWQPGRGSAADGEEAVAKVGRDEPAGTGKGETKPQRGSCGVEIFRLRVSQALWMKKGRLQNRGLSFRHRACAQEYCTKYLYKQVRKGH